MSRTTPLIIDLDGTLLRSDTLHELIAASLGRPRVLVSAAWTLVTRGRAALKRYLADTVDLNVDLLPMNQAVVDFVRTHSGEGRPVYLATGADQAIAQKVVERHPEFHGFFASDGHSNLTSENKARLLVTEFGEGSFDYAGNSTHDLAVWKKADRAILVTSQRKTPRWARGVAFSEVLHETTRPRWATWLKELRVHQSLKNVLIFLPMLAAHSFDVRTALLLLAGFVAFSLMASSVYLLNDLLDLRSDRMHSTKSRRPLAAGLILPVHALAASVALASLAIVMSLAIGAGFALVLIGYAALTVLYSFWFKRITLIDVVVLAMLYMARILAGAVIAGVSLSFWFTGLALFLFISLALVKRYTELSRSSDGDSGHGIPGRGYGVDDKAVILPLGIGTGMAVLLLMAIYIQSDDVSRLYPSAVFLWLVIPALFYWISNVWIQAGRGTMHDDPIVFALKNPASLAAGAVMAGLFIIASTPLAAAVEDLISTVPGR